MDLTNLNKDKKNRRKPALDESSDAVEFAEWVSYMEIWQEGERWLNNEAVFAQNTQELYQLFKGNLQKTEAKTEAIESLLTLCEAFNDKIGTISRDVIKPIQNNFIIQQKGEAKTSDNSIDWSALEKIAPPQKWLNMYQHYQDILLREDVSGFWQEQFNMANEERNAVKETKTDEQILSLIKQSKEIKFRAWDDFKKEMVYCDGLHYWAFFNSPDSIGYGLYHRNDGHRVLSGEYNPPIMQYTGLNDKNGKEIYEGDIVKSAKCLPEDLGVFVVKWDDCCYGLYWDFNSWHCNLNEAEIGALHLSVIGNIYENPELLNQGPTDERSVASKDDQGY